MIYLIVYLYLLVLSFISFYSYRYKKSGFVQATILLVVLASLRYGTGTDFFTYVNIWQGISAFNFSFDPQYAYMEPGFVLFSSLLKAIYSGDIIFFSVYAILTVGILSYGLYKIELNVVAGLLLYFCFFYFVYAFNGMRQALSMSIFIYSLVFLREENKMKYYFINIIGFLFHYSAIVYLVLGFLFFLKITKSQLLIAAFLIVLGGAVAYFTNLFEILIEFIFNVFWEGKSQTYFSNFEGQTDISTFLPRFILFGWILVLTLKLPSDRLLTTIVLFYSIGFAIYLSLLDFNYLNARINTVFRISDIVIALILVEKVRKSYNKFLLYSVFLAIYTAYFIHNISVPANAFILRTSF